MTIMAGAKVRATDFAALSSAWTTWTPTLNNITRGNGSILAAYIQLGKTVHCRFRLTCGSTTVLASTPGVQLPVAAHSDYALHDAIGTAMFYDSSGGSGSRTGGTVVYAPSSSVFFLADRAAGLTVTATTPWTWAAGDTLSWRGSYEAA